MEYLLSPSVPFIFNMSGVGGLIGSQCGGGGKEEKNGKMHLKMSKLA